MPQGGVFYIESATHLLESKMGDSGGGAPGQQRNSVYQRVRNRNNVQEMILRKKVDEMASKLQIDMVKIEMERLDLKCFLKDVRTCDTDDMSEFAPLLSELLEHKVGKTKRTRFRDVMKNIDLDLEEPPIELDYKKIKAAPEKLRRPQLYLSEIARAKTFPEIERWKNQSQAAKRRDSGAQTALVGGETKTNRPISQGPPGLIVTQVSIQEKGLNSNQNKDQGLSDNRAGLSTIPASPVPVQDHFPIKPQNPTRNGRRLSASLPNLPGNSNQNDNSLQGINTNNNQKPTTPGMNFMRTMLDTKEKLKKRRPKPLKHRIETFLEDIKKLSTVPEKKPNGYYLPPISPVSIH